MSTPPYVPVSPHQIPRQGDLQHFPAPRRPVVRPAEITGPQPRGARMGTPTPDAGYALLLARRLIDRVRLGDGERLEDALWAGAIVGMKRAGLNGRGPILADVERGLALLGYLGHAPDDMVAWRQHALSGFERDYHLQRAVVDSVTPDLLDPAAPDLGSLLAGWRKLFAGLPGVPPAPVPTAAPPVSPCRPPPVATQARRTSRIRRLTAGPARRLSAGTTRKETA